jgi:hypothetical protein
MMNAVDVLAEIHTSRPQVREHLFQRHHLLGRHVPTIVDQDVNVGYLLLEPSPKRSVLLISHENRDVVTLVCLAGIFDVNAVDMTLVTEV